MEVFRVVNTTKWPGRVKGKHKNGFALHINRKVIHPGEYLDFKELPSGVQALQSKRFVKLDVIKNMEINIKKEVEKQEKENEARTEEIMQEIETRKAEADLKERQRLEDQANRLKNSKINPKPASSIDKDVLKSKLKEEDEITNKAMVSGGEGEDPLGDLEPSMNPDGEPNFVVKATKGKKGKKRK